MTNPGFTDLVTTPERRGAYEAAGLWDDMTLPGQVARFAAERGGAIAVVDHAGTRRHRYDALDRDASKVAAWLASVGVVRGDVVSIQLPNTYETVVVAVGVLRSGAILNPLLPNYRDRELAYIVETARPRVVFTPAVYRGYDHRTLVDHVYSTTDVAFTHVVVDDAGGPLLLQDILTSDLASVSGDDAEMTSGRDPSAVSELIFTSGTEATPKAIMHTEQTTSFSARAAYEYLGLGDDDVVWMPSPVGHSTGVNYGLRFALTHGLTLVLQDLWDPEVALRLVQDERCSYTLAATTFLQDLVRLANQRKARLPSMRCFGCGGAPVPPELVRFADDVDIRVLRLYGSTEALVVTWNHPGAPANARSSTDGPPIPHVEVELRGDDGTRSAPGIEGEIFTRGPNTCVGFFSDPERTGATFTESGFVRSGDLAMLDEAGNLTISGRKKEIIIRGGINIAPREIEELVLAFPEVERVAIVGIPDPRLGELACACVVLAPGSDLDFETMVARLRATGLATYKLPERLEILDALPTTASGKVQKHVIVHDLRLGESDG